MIHTASSLLLLVSWVCIILTVHWHADAEDIKDKKSEKYQSSLFAARSILFLAISSGACALGLLW